LCIGVAASERASNTVSAKRKRQADVYVFCLLSHKAKATVCPLNLDQWEFYVLSTNQLNNLVGEQKTITLDSLRELNTRFSTRGGREPTHL
jgi:phosphodiesterase/alkaline phosphatase D-like protein